jgi:hypothetical protein
VPASAEPWPSVHTLRLWVDEPRAFVTQLDRRLAAGVDGLERGRLS